MANKRICSIPDCGKPHYGRGWCVAHWERNRRHGNPIGGGTPKGDLLAFLSLALASASDECIFWPYSSIKGYGRVSINGRDHLASRLICERAYGAPPTPGHDAAHSCGNGHRGCVNPAHLRWATRSENIADTLLHGTHNRGERNARAKITDQVAREIKRRLSAGERQHAIAADYGVARTTINNIANGYAWSWLE